MNSRVLEFFPEAFAIHALRLYCLHWGWHSVESVKKSLAVVAAAVFLPFLATPAAAQRKGEDAIVRPARLQQSPKIDGRLDEPLWGEIEPLTDFWQYEPKNGEPGTEKTEVRIGYDSHFLYFGIRAFDNDPEQVIARTFERDANVDNDDSITIAIDARNDNRTAIFFGTNVLGTKLDVQYNDAGAYNKNWDAIWYAKGHIDESGYALEVAIPFFALRFMPADVVEMGLHMARIIRRKSETVAWPYISRDYELDQVSEYGRMVGLENIERGVDLEIKPYGIAGYSETRAESGGEADAGLDVKWGVTSNLTSDLTVNPDFAQVESDALQVNLTRFNLFYPEKRDFFLESADLFQFGLPARAEVFFSRRIGIRGGIEVPIYGGARAYGMVGQTNIGLMTMQTRPSGSFDSENFSVARIKQNVLGRSYFGGIVTSRKGETSFEDTTLGGDFMLLFENNLKINGSLAKSNRPGVSSGNWMGNLSARQDRDLYDWVISYDDIGPNFDPKIGFIARPNQRNLTSNIHYNPRPGWRGVRQLTFGFRYDRIENHDGLPRDPVVPAGFHGCIPNGRLAHDLVSGRVRGRAACVSNRPGRGHSCRRIQEPPTDSGVPIELCTSPRCRGHLCRREFLRWRHTKCRRRGRFQTGTPGSFDHPGRARRRRRSKRELPKLDHHAASRILLQSFFVHARSGSVLVPLRRFYLQLSPAMDLHTRLGDVARLRRRPTVWNTDCPHSKTAP